MPHAQEAPKYSRPEIERRWLVEQASLPPLHGLSVRRISDKYLDGGRLHLRVVEEDGARPIYKLGKKYPAEGQHPESVVSVYLTHDEHAALAVLPGRSARKLRYAIAGGSLDVYEQPCHSFAIFEAEFASREEALSFEAPAFADEEVTFNAKYSGFNLATRPLTEEE